MFNTESNVALQHVLAALEEQRKNIAAGQKKGYFIIAGGIAILILTCVLGFPIPGFIGILALGIFGGIKLSGAYSAQRIYSDKYKRNVIGTALKFIDPSLTIEPNNGIGENEFRHCQLFNTDPDRYKTEDLVMGRAGRTGFYFAEVHAEYKTVERTKEGTRTEWHEIFKGIIFVADFNKNFNGITIIRPKDFGSAFGAWFSKNLFSIGSNDVVKLENADFDKTFVTYGSDQIEARYILTPAMMERILNLNHQSKYSISLSFIESRMYIGFPLARNYFEAPVFKSLLNPAIMDEDITAIKFMYDIVKELDLNTRIWGKN